MQVLNLKRMKENLTNYLLFLFSDQAHDVKPNE